MIAFVDESVYEVGLGVYVIGSVVVPANECDDLREHLTRFGRFHFYRAGETRRLGMLRHVKACRVLTSAYVYRGLFPIGQDGARARCMRRLLRDLRVWDVNELVIESRHGQADLRDRVTVLSAVNSRTAPAALSYKWVAGADDPMLWMPDAIAGAVRANVGTARYEDPLAELGTVIRQVL